MRISDWSSDVCSSDLCAFHDGHRNAARRDFGKNRCVRFDFRHRKAAALDNDDGRAAHSGDLSAKSCWRSARSSARFARSSDASACCSVNDCWRRSEEHTSELQSLMRISYAVFCLKKKTKNKKNEEYSRVHTVTQESHTEKCKQQKRTNKT